MSCNSEISIQIHCQIYREVDLPLYLPLHLPKWAVTVKLLFIFISKSTRGGVVLPADQPASFANMTCNSKILIDIHWQIKRGWGRSASRSDTSYAKMSSKSEIDIQIHWQIYWQISRGVGRSASRCATSSANMSSMDSEIAIQIHW